MRRSTPPPEPPEEPPVIQEAVPEEAVPEESVTHDTPTSEDALLDGTRLGEQGTWAGRWRTLGRLPVTLMLASVLLGLGIVQLTFHLGNSMYRSFTWTQQITQTRARVQALQRDVNILRDAEQAAQDPAYLEELARCQGYVRRSESVIVAPNPPTTPGENCQVIRLP